MLQYVKQILMICKTGFQFNEQQVSLARRVKVTAEDLTIARSDREFVAGVM